MKPLTKKEAVPERQQKEIEHKIAEIQATSSVDTRKPREENKVAPQVIFVSINKTIQFHFCHTSATQNTQGPLTLCNLVLLNVVAVVQGGYFH